MLKNRPCLEIKIQNRSYFLECFPESTWGEVFDVVTAMQGFALDQIKKQTPQPPISDVAPEPPKVGV